jgi:choline dehydrogenase-like flavoprotein
MVSVQEKRSRVMNEHADFLIVGAGAGGATIGGELAEAGAKVVFLEAGKDLDITWQSPKHFAATQTLAQFVDNNLLWHEQYSGRHWRTDMGQCSGGGTTTYGGVLEESTAQDYDKWPISYEEMTPYIDLVKRRYHISRWPMSELSPTAKMLHEVSDGQLDSIQSAFNREPWEQYGVFHDRCKQCRFCLLGCKHNAKANALTIPLPKAKWYGAKVIENSLAIRLNVDRSRSRIESVTYLKRTPQGLMSETVEKKTITADCVVLAAGTMMTPMILHWSGCGGRALADSSGQVGRNMRAHFFHHCLGVLRRDDIRTYQGQVVEVCDRFTNYDNGFLVELNMAAPPSILSMVMEIEKPDKMHQFIGLPFKRLLRDYPRILNVTPMARSHDDGFTDNAVFPHPIQLNKYGLPQPHVRLDPNPQEAEWAENGLQWAKQILRNSGADPNETYTGILDTVHKVGTCRMGASSADSVTDLNGKCWDLDNLWVADASLFPAPLLANCSLIIYALAYRAADALLERSIPAH